MAMEPAMREADGVKIRFAEAGHGGRGETVVMTSPWPESLFAFRKLWDRLAEQFHVVAIDLPGFGQSERQLDLLSPRAMGAFLVQMLREWDLGPVHFVAPDVGTSATLWAAANDPHSRSMAIGGGAMAVPLQVGGSLKDIIDAPDMEGYRKIDSKDILGPVYDAMPEGAPPLDIRDDYLDRTQATGSWSQLATSAHTRPSCQGWQKSCPASRHRSKSSVDVMTHWSRRPTKSSSKKGCPTAGWTCCPQGILHGKKCLNCTATSS